jgi:small GTP-binding protein
MSVKKEASHDYLFKLVLIGDSGVGKTNIISRYVHDRYSANTISTVGIEYSIRNVEIDGKTIKVQIWDTAGQERYRAVPSAYFRGALGAIVVYDITRSCTYDSVGRWLYETHSQTQHQEPVKLLIGNKSDMADIREVAIDDAKAYAESNQMSFMETSAKDSTNIEEAFKLIVHEIYRKMSANEDQDTNSECGSVELKYPMPKGRRKCCVIS